MNRALQTERGFNQIKSMAIAVLFFQNPVMASPQPPYSYRSSGPSQAEIMSARSQEMYRQINASRAVEQSQQLEANQRLNQRLANEAVQRANGQTVFPISGQSNYSRSGYSTRSSGGASITPYLPQRIVIGGEYSTEPPDLSPLDSSTTAINSVPEPEGATHYDYNEGKVEYYNGRTKLNSSPIAKAKGELTPKETLPTQKFPRTYPSFSENSSAGPYAYFQLFDETIGPQTLDGPVRENPVIEDVWSDSINSDRFSTIKALFDKAAVADLETMRTHSAWVGRCVHRSSPNIETGATIGIRVENENTKIVLLVADSAEELMAAQTNAHPLEYDGMNPATVSEITAKLEEAHPALSELSPVPLEGRQYVRDSLFFDVAIPSDPSSRVKTGYRLRMAHGPNGELAPVIEGYAPFKEGTAMASRRVEFLDYIRYCYFSRAYDW